MKSWLKNNLIWIVSIALLIFIFNQLPVFINLMENILTANISLESDKDDGLTDNPSMKCDECLATSTDLFCQYCHNWDLSD